MEEAAVSRSVPLSSASGSLASSLVRSSKVGREWWSGFLGLDVWSCGGREYRGRRSAFGYFRGVQNLN